jgi:GT2 family glycosyltransferase
MTSLSEIVPAQICITIPVFNQLHYTRQCVESLNQGGIADAQIIIVNNASTDGTAEFLTSRPQIQAIHNPKNLGCGAAWTQGAQASKSTWTVISNNDVLFAPDTFSELIHFAEDRRADVASPAMCEGEADYDFPAYAANFMRTMAAVVRWNIASGSCFMVHRRVFEKIGFFDDDPKLGGYEDDEFFRRARRAGFRLAITGRAYYHHFGSATQKSIKASLNQPSASLGDRTYYRKKTGQTWVKRKTTQLKHAARSFWWKNAEQLRYGHTLHEKRIGGKWYYC